MHMRGEYVSGNRVKSGINGFNATLLNLMRGLVTAILVVSVFAMFTAVASATELHVGPGQTYSTIQSAENAATAGDTLGTAPLIYAQQFPPTQDEIIISLPRGDVSVQRDADGFARFRGKHLQQLGETGEPSIPYQAITVLLPPNVDLATLKARVISPQWEKVDGEWDIPPIPPVATWDGEKVLVMWPKEKNIVDGRDMGVYTTDAVFPAEPIARVDTIVMRKWNMAQVFYAAYRYNPVERTHYRLSGGRLQITFDRDPTKGPVVTSDYIGIEQVKQLAINFDKAVGEYGGYAKSSPGRYVIITTSAIQSASTELADFVTSKEARGFTVQVVTEGTWGGGIGDTAADNIRTWLQNNYNALNIEYVLLIGNPNPSSGDVPMKMCYPQDYDTDYEQCPTDFYYAELTSNWSSDGDSRYGEYDDDFSGDPPRGAEVTVGRIPYYGSITDLDHILSKIITYENTQAPDGSWRQKVLLPMKPSDASTPGYHLGEEIKSNTLSPKGWDYHRVYDEDYGLSPPPETTPCNVTGVTNAWKGSQFGGIFWWTHGSSTSASSVMDLTHAATLDDNHPGFTFQCSCTNGHPETTNNLGYSLLKNGCVNTVSASRVSWYYKGQTSFDGTSTNSGMTYEYSKRLITEEMRAGNALNDLKLDIAPEHEVMWMNYLGFNVYGCPAVGLFTFGGPAPDITVDPASIAQTLAPGGTANQNLIISNTVAGSYLSYTVAVTNQIGPSVQPQAYKNSGQTKDFSIYDDLPKGSDAADGKGDPQINAAGGPDTYGYTWKDSNEDGGPTYSWTDISASGTLSSVSSQDDGTQTVSLPFTFSYYGTDYTTVNICSNGNIHFGAANYDWSNSAIPNSDGPSAMIAPFWDDLNPWAGGNVYYLGSGSEFIVQWDGVQRYGDASSVETFQVILYPDGKIKFQYHTLTGALSSCTVGIEDAAETDGLLVVYNAAYLENELAVEFTPPVQWISVSPTSGAIIGDASENVVVSFDATGLANGLYTADIVISSNDPDEPSVTVPAHLTVVTTGQGVIASCNSIGDDIDQFAPGFSVYAKGEGLEADTNYTIWIQDDPVNGGDALVDEENPESAETPKNVTTDSTGNFSPMLIWSIPPNAAVTYHEYDIVVDKQNDGANTGKYNADSDGIDSASVVGFTAPVPELPTIILFSIGLLVLVGYLGLRRKK